VREEQIQADSGVRFAAVVPGITETNLDGDGHGERRGMLDVVGIHQPEEVAVVAVNAFEENAAARVVGFNNKVLQLAQNLVPSATTAARVAWARGAPEESDDLGIKHD
jgi:short-subunit dehydrogenase